MNKPCMKMPRRSSWTFRFSHHFAVLYCFSLYTFFCIHHHSPPFISIHCYPFVCYPRNFASRSSIPSSIVFC